MVRVAAERGLIADPKAWFGYRELRNMTSHTYNPDKGAKVFAAIPKFAVDARSLLGRLNDPTAGDGK